MNTCGTCKHFGKAMEREDWVGEDDDEPVVTVFHECGLLKHLNDCGREFRIADQIAGTIDGSGYYSALCVREEFGCNQWVAADRENASE
jgi:hypothetical protein